MNFHCFRTALSGVFALLSLPETKAQKTRDRKSNDRRSSTSRKVNWLWEWRGVWIVTPTIAGIVIAMRLLGWLQPWEWMAFDQYVRTRPQELTDDRIVIVGINEADLRKVRQWPIPDALLAQLLEKIKAQNPKVIGLDLYRDLPVQPGYSTLAKVFETTPNLVGIEKVDEQNPSAAVAPPPILAQRGQVGVNNVVVDTDGKLRRGVLAYKKNGEPIPSFSMLVAGIYLEQQNILPQPRTDNPKIFQWGKHVFRPFQPNDGGYVRADDGGYQFLLNYRGPANSFRTVSLTQVLEGRIPKDLMRDRIVLIGSTATSLNDFFYTPYSGEQISTQQRTTGVEIQANIISHILSTALDGRPSIQTWPESVEWLWIVLWSGVGATLTWRWRYTGGVRSLSFHNTASPFLAAGALLGITYAAFLAGWWIPVVPPVLGLSLSAIAITAFIAHTARRIRKILGRYLDDSIVAEVLENPEGLKIGGECRKITILTSDLRGFTALSEQLKPQEVVKILNIYLEQMADAIAQYQGTIDEIIGDGILVLFGTPTARDDDAQRAIACAVAMQLAMISVNEKMKQLGFPKLEMGIGINTGEVVVGNIGSEKRIKYSAIGSPVNLTFRVESYTVGGQILISELTLQEVRQPLRIDGRKQVKPKGVNQSITIYEVGGIAGKYNLFLPQKETIFFSLPEQIWLEFHYALLDGKHIGDALFKGRLVKLSAQGALVRAENADRQAVPKPLSNIKLTLLTPNTPTEANADIYAKVLDKSAEPGSFYIHFTAQPPSVAAMLEALYQRAKMLPELAKNADISFD
jgi:adenylate cyclase